MRREVIQAHSLTLADLDMDDDDDVDLVDAMLIVRRFLTNFRETIGRWRPWARWAVDFVVAALDIVIERRRAAQ